MPSDLGMDSSREGRRKGVGIRGTVTQVHMLSLETARLAPAWGSFLERPFWAPLGLCGQTLLGVLARKGGVVMR